MNCEFQSLHSGSEGYVVRCRHCGHYQVAFITTVLTLSELEFKSFCRQVKNTVCRQNGTVTGRNKTVVLQTPLQGVCICVMMPEAISLLELLEEAEAESSAQALISLFNP